METKYLCVKAPYEDFTAGAIYYAGCMGLIDSIGYECGQLTSRTWVDAGYFIPVQTFEHDGEDEELIVCPSDEQHERLIFETFKVEAVWFDTFKELFLRIIGLNDGGKTQENSEELAKLYWPPTGEEITGEPLLKDGLSPANFGWEMSREIHSESDCTNKDIAIGSVKIYAGPAPKAGEDSEGECIGTLSLKPFGIRLPSSQFVWKTTEEALSVIAKDNAAFQSDSKMRMRDARPPSPQELAYEAKQREKALDQLTAESQSEYRSFPANALREVESHPLMLGGRFGGE